MNVVDVGATTLITDAQLKAITGRKTPAGVCSWFREEGIKCPKNIETGYPSITWYSFNTQSGGAGWVGKTDNDGFRLEFA